MHTVIYDGLTVGTILAFLGGGLGVAIVAQFIKRIFKLQSTKVIHVVVIALSAVTTGLSYVISALHSNPSIIGSHTAGIYGLANAAYVFVVKDADAFISKVKSALNTPQVVNNQQQVVSTLTAAPGTITTTTSTATAPVSEF